MKSTTRRAGRPVAVATLATLVASIATWSGGMVAAQGAESPAAGTDSHTYLVVTQGSVSALSAGSLETTVEDAGGADVTTYDSINAAVATLTEAEAKAIDSKPGFVVSKDAKMSAIRPGETIDSEVKGEGTTPGGAQTASLPQVGKTAVATSWGLDRVDQRSAVVDGSYRTPAGISGTGIDVYVFDSGIALDHPEFAGRIGESWDFVGDGNGPGDCDGHGTHVAGTIGSTRFGVAPDVTLHAARVLDCEGAGSLSNFILALDTVANSNPPVASVANASLGSPYNSAVNAAVANFIERTGMPFVVAAGNDGDYVSDYSPASTLTATTVAASEKGTNGYDYDAAYSNFGPGIDIYAPGTDIWSTNAFDPAGMSRASGTSMAAPHVAGYYALYFSAHPDDTVPQAEADMKSQATNGTLYKTYGGTPNRVLYTAGILAIRPVSVSVAKTGYGNVLSVNVNPDRAASSYSFRVQKRSTNGSWSYLSTVYKTEGTAETKSISLGAGTFRVVVPASTGYAARTSAAVTLTAPTVKVITSRDSAKSKLTVNVNPDKGSGYWTFKVQKRSGSTWKTLSTTYTTAGTAETRTVDLTAGTYRVVVASKYSYRGATSAAVSLVR